MRRRSCRSASRVFRSFRCSTWPRSWETPCRSGISATISATPICWWSSRRRAARSRARSARIPAVLMRRHGATVVGGNVRELVFRSIAMCQNAEYQMRALTLGKLWSADTGRDQARRGRQPVARSADARVGLLDCAGGERQAVNESRYGLPTALIDIEISARREARAASCTRAIARSRRVRSLADGAKKAHAGGMIAGQEAAQ